MFEQKLNEYIRLIITAGVAVVEGDDVHISSDVKNYEFTQKVVEAAYKAGAANVRVDWGDEVVARLRGLHADDKVFDIYPQYEADKLLDYVAKNSKRLSITSPDPNGMDGVDSSKIMRQQVAANEPIKPYRSAMMGDHLNWCIAAVPSPAWAMKVFPGIPEEEAMTKLWDAIFDAVHLNDGPDAVENWMNHTSKIKENVDKLNDLKLTSLHYTAANGTDLVVGLPKGHIWSGGGAVNVDTEQFFSPNMPTEEAYTLPDCNHVDGVVYSSKPLLFSGQLIDKFNITFKDGKAVEAHAEVGDEMLQEMIAVDEGASRLGEVALVPYESPISLSDNLFYMTLFDENASCHLAFGMAYETTLPTTIGKSDEEAKAMGLNKSIIHVDFMMGTQDMNIMGTTEDGREVPIFVDGNFAI